MRRIFSIAEVPRRAISGWPTEANVLRGVVEIYLGFTDYSLSGRGVTIDFNNGVLDGNGCAWNIDGPLNGWDSPDGRVTMLTRIGTGPNADGEIPADQHYRGRTLTFSLSVACPSEAARELSRYLLAQALDLVDSTGTLVVNEETPKFVTISRSGNNSQGKLTMLEQGLSSQPVATPGFAMPTPDSDGLVYVMKTDVEVYCADPRKYATTSITTPWGSIVGGFWGAVVSNPGNTFTQSVAMVLNSPAAGSIECFTGPNLEGGVILAVPSTPGPALPGFPSVLGIDAYKQTIEDGSGNNYYYLRSLLNAPPWPAIGPGGGSVVLLGGLVGVTGELVYYPAWI